jgi:osmotically-inducible protein OsmY
MTTTITTQDEALRESLVKQLAWRPDVDATMVAISVKAGVVTLNGYVDTYAAKLAAERVVRTVYGVKAIANELEVKLAQERIDPDIARDAAEALRNNTEVPFGIAVTVRAGYITLTGTVGWMYQKTAAERAVKSLRGVRGVYNHIVVKPTVSAGDVRKRILEALHRHADVDARRINIVAEDSTVILSGNVRSCAERQEAEDAAWAAPGVAVVDNRLAVVP